MMREAGFVDIEGRMIQLHTCGWSSGQSYIMDIRRPTADILTPIEPREYEIGVANRENVQRLLSSAAVYPLTEILGYAFV